MKVATPESQLKGSHGLKETATATIKANAHAFRMLSSGLYSNKIAAVLREISCNAADAHIEAGTPDLPIEVKLPTKLNEQFYIKDWGPGLSHAQMIGTPSTPGLYLNYFDSTKQDSNTQTGAFGLGCKSPFSYTDSFTVTSVHGGVKRIYSVYVGDAGLPTISLMNEAPADADWPHGVSVSFPVDTGDVWTFAQEAQNIFKWFRTTPKILGTIKIEPVQYAYTTNEYGILKIRTHQTVLMGNVHYDLYIPSLNLETNAVEQTILENMNIVIKANIGDIQVTPSRESISYDAKSIDFIRTVIRHAGRDLCTHISKEVETAIQRGWGAVCELQNTVTELFTHHHRIKHLFEALGFQVAYSELYSQRSYPLEKMPSTPDGENIKTSTAVNRRDGLKIISTQIWSKTQSTPHRIDLVANSALVYGKPKRVRDRIRKTLHDTTYAQVIHTHDEATARELSTALFNMPMVDAETLDYPPAPIRTKKGQKAPLPAEQFTVITLQGDKKLLRPDEITDDCKYYVIDASYTTWGTKHTYYELYGRQTDDYTWECAWTNFSNLRKKIAGDIKGYTLIKKRHIKRMQANGWVELAPAITAWLNSTPVQTRIDNTLKSWSPTVDLEENPGFIVEILCKIKHEYPAYFDEIKPALKDLKVLPVIEKVYTASLDGDITETPKLVELYNKTGNYFMGTTRSIQKSTSISGLSEAILKATPGFEFLCWQKWKRTLSTTPAQFSQLVQALIGIGTV